MTDRSELTPPSPSSPPVEPTPPGEPPVPAWGAAAQPMPPVPVAAVPVQYQQVTGQQTHQGALWSMVLGIVGLASGVLAIPTSGITAPGIICSPVAFGLGLWSSKVVRERPDVYGNRGQAIAGWVMGLIGMLLAVAALVLAVAVVALVIWIFAGVEQ